MNRKEKFDLSVHLYKVLLKENRELSIKSVAALFGYSAITAAKIIKKAKEANNEQGS